MSVPPEKYKWKYFFPLFIILSMDSQYQLLAKRDKKLETFTNNRKKQFMTNYFNVTIDEKKALVYQYAFSLPEEIPHDSMFYEKSIRSIRKVLKEEYGYLCHKGQMFWGTKKVEVPTVKDCSFKFGDTDFGFDGFITKTRELNLRDLSSQENKDQILQILNIELKNMLRNANMMELGKKGEYFPKKLHLNIEKQITNSGLNVDRGFRFTLVPLLKGISLQVDVCSSVTQSSNFLETISGMKPEQVKTDYIGSIVHTNYGTKKRTYKIEDIDFNKSPLNEFHHTKLGGQISYMKYYEETYGIKVTKKQQPLLKVVGRVEQILKNGKMEKSPEYIFLIPEFVSLTGLTENQRTNRSTMAKIAPHTKVNPSERIKESRDIVEKLRGKDGLLCIEDSQTADGLVLDRPNILYSQRQNPNDQGLMKNRGKLRNPYKFKDWVVVHSRSNKGPDDSQNCISTLKAAGETYGIEFNTPLIVKCSGTVSQWISSLERDIKQHGIPEIIVFILNDYEEKYYPELKNFCINVLKTPSQFIRRRTLSKDTKGAMSAASKIGIQMNIKMGATPWTVEKSHPYFKNRNVMYGALSMSKGKKGFTLAFVGTIANDCSKVFSDVKLGIERKQEIPSVMLEEIFINWAKNFFQTNSRKVPETIILYREGLSDAQIEDQLPRTELPALHGMITKISERTKTPNYNPEIMIVVVNKKVNSKFYSLERTLVNNPVSGSVITDSFSTSEQTYSFHLAAQQVNQGSCTPTLYKVVHDTSKMPKEALVNFTFEQCFNYYNWEGAVRVPACLQCADKLAKLFGESIQKNFESSALNKQHFFL